MEFVIPGIRNISLENKTESAVQSRTGPKSPIGWWEIPRYSTWDLGNKYAYSQSTLVGRSSSDAPEKLANVHSAMPTLFDTRNSIAETQHRISFSKPVSESYNISTSNELGVESDTDMGRAHRLNTLMHNPDLIAQYHRAAKLTMDPDVRFEYAKELLLCGSLTLASDPGMLHSDDPKSRLVMEGVYWIHQLANKQRHVNACFVAGRWYELGKYGCEVNPKKAIKYLQISSKGGHKAALYHLGHIYEILKKTKKAKECFDASSKKGFSLATYRLGMAFLSGSLNVQPDFSMACSLLREALYHPMHPVSDAGYHLAVALIQLPSFDRHKVSDPHIYLKRAWILGNNDAGALLRDLLR